MWRMKENNFKLKRNKGEYIKISTTHAHNFSNATHLYLLFIFRVIICIDIGQLDSFCYRMTETILSSAHICSHFFLLSFSLVAFFVFCALCLVCWIWLLMLFRAVFFLFFFFSFFLWSEWPIQPLFIPTAFRQINSLTVVRVNMKWAEIWHR